MMMSSYKQDMLPDAVKVPAGHKVAMETVGVGEITYECRAKAGTMGEHEWVFVGPKAALLAQLVGSASPAAVLVTANAEGKEVAARLAVKTNGGLLTDATALTSDLTAEQPIFGGSVVVQSKVASSTPIVAVRANSTAPVEAAGAGTVESVSDAYVRLSSPANITGVPALSVPVGQDAAGMPIGAHLSTPIVMPDGETFGTLCCFSAAPNEALKMRDLMTLRHCAQLVARKILVVRERQRLAMQDTEIMTPDWALEPLK